MSSPIYTIQWIYRENKGRKAERLGPYMLRAELVQHCEDSSHRHEKRIQLGAISVEAINDVSQRHAFWVITEAALLPLNLDPKTTEQISAELSRIVPPPREGEIIDIKKHVR